MGWWLRWGWVKQLAAQQVESSAALGIQVEQAGGRGAGGWVVVQSIEEWSDHRRRREKATLNH